MSTILKTAKILTAVAMLGAPTAEAAGGVGTAALGGGWHAQSDALPLVQAQAVIRDHRWQTTTVYARYGRVPDLNAYCRKHHGAEARLTGFSALDWVCWKGPSKTWGISVKRACTEQHGLPMARYVKKSDPYSWYCARPVVKKRPDLNAYCRRHHGAEARLTGFSALDWVCWKGPDKTWGISVKRACIDQHGLHSARYDDKGDPYSWHCRR